MRLIQDAEDWERFKVQFTRANQSAIQTWATPAEYPCMAAATLVGTKVRTCFFYLADAVILCQAHGIGFDKASEAKSSPEVVAVNTIGPEQKDFNLSLSAHIMTLMRFMIETGICKTDGYERAYAVELSRLEQLLSLIHI